MQEGKIIKYQVVRRNIYSYGRRERNFEDHVNHLITQGWEPIGGVSYVQDDWYCQAMVKREKIRKTQV